MTKPAIPSSLESARPASEPGPVKAERSDRREQASRREALTGGSDATYWYTREWQAGLRRWQFLAPFALLLCCSSARFALLPFALLMSCWSSCRLVSSITSGCCHLKRDLPLTVAGKFRSSPCAQSPELGDPYSLVFPMWFSVRPILLIPTPGLFSDRPLRPAAQAAAFTGFAWLLCSGS
jgi:hypothetical protein